MNIPQSFVQGEFLVRYEFYMMTDWAVGLIKSLNFYKLKIAAFEVKFIANLEWTILTLSNNILYARC